MKTKLLLLLLIPLLLQGCLKDLIDYRDKWVGEWNMEQIRYNYVGGEVSTKAYVAQVEKAEEGGLYIAGAHYYVDEDGTIIQPARSARYQSSPVGQISRKTFSIDINTSAGVWPGAQILFLGYRDN